MNIHVQTFAMGHVQRDVPIHIPGVVPFVETGFALPMLGPIVKLFTVQQSLYTCMLCKIEDDLIFWENLCQLFVK